MLLTESHKVELILVLFVLDFADFLNFVVVDLECATLKLDALELRHGLACGVWSLEANKAVWVLALFLRKESDAFDITVLAEKVTDVLFRTGLWDVFDEKVALFLGVLVLDSIAQNFLFAGLGRQEGLDVDLFSANFLSVEIVASLQGSGRS